MNFDQSRGILLGCSTVLLLLIIGFCLLLPKRTIVKIIEKLFNIDRPDPTKPAILFYGVEVDLKSSRRVRYSFITLLAILIWINMLLLVDGCILRVLNLSLDDPCPTLNSKCFEIISISSHPSFDCPVGGTVSNISDSYVICFVWIYQQQHAVEVLNQLGICSSVFSLLCHGFQGLCCLGRKWWGLLILIFTSTVLMGFIIASLIIEFNISMTAKLLLLGADCLTLNVIHIVRFTHYPRWYYSIRKKITFNRSNIAFINGGEKNLNQSRYSYENSKNNNP